jgi:hypothetical protein
MFQPQSNRCYLFDTTVYHQWETCYFMTDIQGEIMIIIINEYAIVNTLCAFNITVIYTIFVKKLISTSIWFAKRNTWKMLLCLHVGSLQNFLRSTLNTTMKILLHKRRWISWLAERLLNFHEGLWSTVLVTEWNSKSFTIKISTV